MKVYHTEFGKGRVVNSTEQLNAEGVIVSADVMFEHGIEQGLPLFELTYSAKKAHKGMDIGKPGKNFKKIAAKAAKAYGSKEAGGRVAGAILKKLRKKHHAEAVEVEQGSESTSKVVAKHVDPLHKNSLAKDIKDKKIGGRGTGAEVYGEEAEQIDEGKKKSSYTNGAITVGYLGKKYKSEHKAHKAAKRALKKGSDDPSIYKYGSKTNEEAELKEAKKLSKKQKKIAKMGGDPSKIDAEDFAMLRAKKGKKHKKHKKHMENYDASCTDMPKGKKNKKHPDEAEDKALVKKMVKKSSLKNENVTPASAEMRNEAVEHSIRNILSQNLNIRQAAKEQDFKNRAK